MIVVALIIGIVLGITAGLLCGGLLCAASRPCACNTEPDVPYKLEALAQ